MTIPAPVATRVSAPAGIGPVRPSNDDARAEEIDGAARAFEKLLVQRLLGDMRRAARGGEDASNAMGNWESMFDEKIAGIVTEHGGLGFGDALSRDLGGSGDVALVQRRSRTGMPAADMAALRALAVRDPAAQPPPSGDRTAPARTHPEDGIARPRAGLAMRARPASEIVAAPAALAPPDDDRTSFQDRFIAPLLGHAERNARRLGTRPEAILAVAALETGWGRHPIVDADGADSHNLFGIKATGDAVRSGVVHRTTEFIGGAARKLEATFHRFDSPGEAVDGFADFVLDNPRYAPALAVADDPERFLRALHDAGYATDPDYADKAIDLMRRVRARLDGPDAPRTTDSGRSSS